MTIKIPLSLGPSWQPKAGAFLIIIAGGLDLLPDTAPGAAWFKPWTKPMVYIGSAFIGFTTRQTKITSEQQGVQPMPNPNAVPAPNPLTPPKP